MLFNASVVQFDAYSIPVVATGIFTLLLGVFVLVREQGSLIARRYALFAGSVSLYAFGAGVSYAVTTQAASLLWDRIAHVGVLVIPLSFLAATVAILGETPGHRRTLRYMAVATAVLEIILWTTDWIIAGSLRYFWSWYPQYGVVGILYVIYFALVMGFALQLYLRRYKITTDARTRIRLQHFVIAIVVGFAAAVDFLPTLGIELYAFGYLPIALFAGMTGYAIIRFRLVDITPELAAPTILQTMGSAVLVVDTGGIVRVANSDAHRLFGVQEPNLLNRALVDVARRIFEPEGLQDLEVPFRDREIPWTVDGGEMLSISVSATVLHDRFGKPTGTVYVGHDVTRRREAEEQLRHAALYDELTGLPNRKLFFDRLETMIADSGRQKRKCAILYLDLDGFKVVNDTYGHAAGDTLLKTVASRIESTIRVSDTVARIGGDEFVVLCGYLNDWSNAEVVVMKIREALEASIPLPSGDGVRIGASIGMALWPDDGASADVLIAAADDRMYAQKRPQ